MSKNGVPHFPVITDYEPAALSTLLSTLLDPQVIGWENPFASKEPEKDEAPISAEEKEERQRSEKKWEHFAYHQAHMHLWQKMIAASHTLEPNQLPEQDLTLASSPRKSVKVNS